MPTSARQPKLAAIGNARSTCSARWRRPQKTRISSPPGPARTSCSAIVSASKATSPGWRKSDTATRTSCGLPASVMLNLRDGRRNKHRKASAKAPSPNANLEILTMQRPKLHHRQWLPSAIAVDEQSPRYDNNPKRSTQHDKVHS